MPLTPVRNVVRGILLLVFGLLFAALAVEATSKLWASYQDSPWWLYASYGGASSVLAAACLVLGVRSLRHR